MSHGQIANVSNFIDHENAPHDTSSIHEGSLFRQLRIMPVYGYNTHPILASGQKYILSSLVRSHRKMRREETIANSWTILANIAKTSSRSRVCFSWFRLPTVQKRNVQNFVSFVRVGLSLLVFPKIFFALTFVNH